MERFDGSADLQAAIATLADHVPEPLRPLARAAFDYAWSWIPGGRDVFTSIDPLRWEMSHENPVRFLHETAHDHLERAASDGEIVEGARALADALDARPTPDDDATTAFFCTEFALHRSLPIYSGGLGVLAGDILKEAADRRLGYAGVGILYRQGYFHQRIDPSGWQHEYWETLDPELLPAVLVTGPDGTPLTITVPIRGREVVTQIWRVNVGGVPLFLLDAQRFENEPIDRWITARLYVGDRRFRLQQYAMLGIGGMMAMRAMGREPDVVHLNEGHAALAPLELTRSFIDGGASWDEALRRARERTVFTTHTPIAAGNESYTAAEVVDVLGDLPARLGVDAKDVLALGRVHPEDAEEPFGMTPLGLRVSAAANGVSKLHGSVARGMWKHLYPDRSEADVPISHVTNGVHLPTWMAPPMRALLGRTLGPGWESRAADPATWEAIEEVSDEELWHVRCELRSSLVAYARERATADRLARGEPMEYVESAMRAFDPDILTLGFARRATAYKRLYLLTYDPVRALALLEGPRSVQLLLAGKPHPQDEEAKRILQRLFELKWAPHVSERVAFLEDYDLRMGAHLVSGCDVWINTPRPPLEACGTSGMKAALNGGLHLSVLDGWWAEGFDGSNGWAIPTHAAHDDAAQDLQDAASLYDLIEREVLPLFYDRDERGIPRGWVAKMKASLRTNGPRFSAGRMLEDYARTMYPR